MTPQTPRRAYVVAGNRVPFGRAGGAYKDVSSKDLLTAAIDGLVARTGLGGLVDVGSWSVTVRETGARLAVESADAASARSGCWAVIV